MRLLGLAACCRNRGTNFPQHNAVLAVIEEQPEAKDVHEDFVTWEATSEDEKDDETDARHDEKR